MNTKVKNTLEGRQQSRAVRSVFSPMTIALMIVLGVFSFSAYFVLSGFSDKFKTGNNGAAHVLSKSAIGYAGLLHLLKQNAHDVQISRSAHVQNNNADAVRILTLGQQRHAVSLDEITLDTPTLIILPKWNTTPDQKHKGWVQKRNTPFPDTLPEKRIQNDLQKLLDSVSATEINFERTDAVNKKVAISPSVFLETTEVISFYNFPKLQIISGDDLYSLVVSDKGTILAQIADTDIFILSDPDFLNTQGIAKQDIAEFALDVMRALETQTISDGFVFDLSLHGFSPSQNFIKLALTPPFLALSLCLLAVLILTAWQAIARFGAPAMLMRDISLGKLSLINNASNFIMRAGRAHKMAPEYTTLTKKFLALQLKLPAGISDAEVSKRLDIYARHAGMDMNWSTLEAQVKTSSQEDNFMQSARKLYNWRNTIISGDNHGRT